MPPSQFASPFEQLSLSDDDKAALRRTADELLADAQAKYERHLAGDGLSYSDSPQWTLARQADDLRVHRDRRPGGGTGNSKIHSFLTEGTVVGGLEDVMFGLLNTTTHEMRVRTAYMGDTIVGGAILSAIQNPSYEHPFESLSVRWRVKGVPLLMRVLTNHGDNIVLEAMGMRGLANGQQFGFHLMQSVAFPSTPRLPNFQRYNMSSCSLWRQAEPARVQVFVTTFLEMPDAIPDSIGVKAACDAYISLCNVMECALLKKLTWLAQNNNQKAAPRNAPPPAGEGCCSVCDGATRSSARSCAICANRTCKTCRVKKKLVVPAPDDQLLKQEMRFCLPCLARAHCLDAAQIAQCEAERKHPRRG